MISKDIFYITPLYDPELISSTHSQMIPPTSTQLEQLCPPPTICLHTGQRFQVLLFNTINSIKYQVFVFIQLDDQTVLFDPKIEPYEVLSLRVRPCNDNEGVLVISQASVLSEPRYHSLVSYLGHLLRGLTPLQTCRLCFLCTLARYGYAKWTYTVHIYIEHRISKHEKHLSLLCSGTKLFITFQFKGFST